MGEEAIIYIEDHEEMGGSFILVRSPVGPFSLTLPHGLCHQSIILVLVICLMLQQTLQSQPLSPYSGSEGSLLALRMVFAHNTSWYMISPFCVFPPFSGFVHHISWSMQLP